VKRNEIKASYLNVNIRQLESFLDFYDVSYGKKQLNKMLPKMNKPSGNNAYSISQIQDLLDGTQSLRNKAIILFLCTSGARRGMITGLKMNHITPIEDCYSLRVYAEDAEDENAEYVTFVTSEARRIFEKYLNYRREKGEEITQESFAFVKEQKERQDLKEYDPYGQITEDNVGEIIKTIIKSSKIRREKARNNSRRYAISQVHGFRHFFRTALTKAKIIFEDKEIPVISTDDKEKMMGHRSTSNLSMRYYDADIESLFKEYKKAIPHLTIQKHLRQDPIIEKLQKQIKQKDSESAKEMQYLQIKVMQLERDLQSRTDDLISITRRINSQEDAILPPHTNQ